MGGDQTTVRPADRSSGAAVHAVAAVWPAVERASRGRAMARDPTVREIAFARSWG
jgi:hypothetical protein